MHHHIVGIESVFNGPYPDFVAPAPHTCSLTSYVRTSPEELINRIKDATIVITTTVRLDAKTLSPEATPKLQALVVSGSGTDCIDLAAARIRRIPVMNCRDAPTEVVTDHAIGLYYALRRKTILMHNITLQDPSEWKAKGAVVRYLNDSDGKAPISAADEIIGIVGYGAIGKRIEMVARLLGMRVLIADRKDGNKSITKDTQTPRVPFEEVLERSTVIMLTLPRTRESLNLISTAELRTMQHHAVMVNVSRGGIVDEKAVFEALESGQIDGYAQDVFTIEPAEGAKDSPLLSPDAKSLNLVLSPHVAWYGQKTKQNLNDIAKQNVELFMEGTLQNTVQ